MANGARAAKVCGAGGGGCVIVLIEKGTRQRVEDAIREHGGQPLNFQVARRGTAISLGDEGANGQGMSMFTDDKGKLQPLWASVFSLLLSAAGILCLRQYRDTRPPSSIPSASNSSSVRCGRCCCWAFSSGC